MAKAVERLTFTDMLPGGGRKVVDAKPSEKSQTPKARRISETRCARCNKPIGRAVFVEVTGCLNGPQLYHRPCVSV